MTAALEGGEWSAARPGRTLPPGKTRYPFYKRLGGPQGRSGRAENLVPTGIRSQTVQPVVSRYTDWDTGPIHWSIGGKKKTPVLVPLFPPHMWQNWPGTRGEAGLVSLFFSLERVGWGWMSERINLLTLYIDAVRRISYGQDVLRVHGYIDYIFHPFRFCLRR